MFINYVGLKFLQVIERSIEFHIDLGKTIIGVMKDDVQDKIDLIKKNSNKM